MRGAAARTFGLLLLLLEAGGTPPSVTPDCDGCEWHIGEWDEGCSCPELGSSVRKSVTREVTCKACDASGCTVLEDDRCLTAGGTKPAPTEMCPSIACAAGYKAAECEWVECTQDTCCMPAPAVWFEHGWQMCDCSTSQRVASRGVVCNRGGADAADAECEPPKPTTERSCPVVGCPPGEEIKRDASGSRAARCWGPNPSTRWEYDCSQDLCCAPPPPLPGTPLASPPTPPPPAGKELKKIRRLVFMSVENLALGKVRAASWKIMKALYLAFARTSVASVVVDIFFKQACKVARSLVSGVSTGSGAMDLFGYTCVAIDEHYDPLSDSTQRAHFAHALAARARALAGGDEDMVTVFELHTTTKSFLPEDEPTLKNALKSEDPTISELAALRELVDLDSAQEVSEDVYVPSPAAEGGQDTEVADGSVAAIVCAAGALCVGMVIAGYVTHKRAAAGVAAIVGAASALCVGMVSRRQKQEGVGDNDQLHDQFHAAHAQGEASELTSATSGTPMGICIERGSI